MNKKATKSKQATKSKMKGSSVWRKISFLTLFLFMSAFTLIIAQNRQTLLQFADVQQSLVPKNYYCLHTGSGGSKYCNVSISAQSTCTKLTNNTLSLNANFFIPGDIVKGNITYTNKCGVEFDVQKMGIQATNQDTPKNTIDFQTNVSISNNDLPLIAGQQQPVQGTYTISSNTPAGTYKAYGTYTPATSATTSTPQAANSPSVTFSVCNKPLKMSISLNPTTIILGQTFKYTLTLQNQCNVSYPIKQVTMIGSNPSFTGDLTLMPPQKGNITIPANGSKTITGSNTIPTSFSLKPDISTKKNQWTATGSYTNIDGTVVTSNPGLAFVLKAPPPPKTPAQAATANKACTSALKQKLVILFPTYTGGTVTLSPSKQFTAFASALINAGNSVKVTITGYTDNTPFMPNTPPPINTNPLLAQARADAVKKALVNLKVKNSITAKGAGATTKFGSNTQDRRAEVTTSCGTSNGAVSGGAGSNSGGSTSGNGKVTIGKTGGVTVTCTGNTNPKPNSKNEVCLGEACTTSVGPGTCLDNGSWPIVKGTNGTPQSGSFIPGACPGPSTEECFVPQKNVSKTANLCTGNGGTCMTQASLGLAQAANKVMKTQVTFTPLARYDSYCLTGQACYYKSPIVATTCNHPYSCSSYCGVNRTIKGVTYKYNYHGLCANTSAPYCCLAVSTSKPASSSCSSVNGQNCVNLVANPQTGYATFICPNGGADVSTKYPSCTGGKRCCTKQ